MLIRALVRTRYPRHFLCMPDCSRVLCLRQSSEQKDGTGTGEKSHVTCAAAKKYVRRVSSAGKHFAQAAVRTAFNSCVSSRRILIPIKSVQYGVADLSALWQASRITLPLIEYLDRFASRSQQLQRNRCRCVKVKQQASL
ncbi:hypothetical protein F2P81_023802 [Scophthalmus maximus]|uniref:Uncharacterized protein n=1 Tax=Scophthalmus maximus TaxID=52904 RepID=A0A6A4RVS0_SCOMX|nr:hypothetical protein F2P81_023802 [Scophthalmus maximus]